MLSCVSGCPWPVGTIFGQCCVTKPRTGVGHRLVAGLVCARWERNLTPLMPTEPEQLVTEEKLNFG